MENERIILRCIVNHVKGEIAQCLPKSALEKWTQHRTAVLPAQPDPVRG